MCSKMGRICSMWQLYESYYWLIRKIAKTILVLWLNTHTKGVMIDSPAGKWYTIQFNTWRSDETPPVGKKTTCSGGAWTAPWGWKADCLQLVAKERGILMWSMSSPGKRQDDQSWRWYASQTNMPITARWDRENWMQILWHPLRSTSGDCRNAWRNHEYLQHCRQGEASDWRSVGRLLELQGKRELYMSGENQTRYCQLAEDGAGKELITWHLCR